MLFSIVIPHKVQNTYEKCLVYAYTIPLEIVQLILVKLLKLTNMLQHPTILVSLSNLSNIIIVIIGERMMEIPSSGQF
jgi:hypothetical protein